MPFGPAGRGRSVVLLNLITGRGHGEGRAAGGDVLLLYVFRSRFNVVGGVSYQSDLIHYFASALCQSVCY